MGMPDFSSTFSSNLTTVIGAVLAGFGFWTTRSSQKHLNKQADRNQHRHQPQLAPEPAQILPILPKTQQPLQPIRQPLRVIRMIDADQPLANAGRMVISGRMSDVCAELDRLAA